ncbi:hypothetical protein C3747_263g54 [Trypanosoma cruzi]|uniref:Uncharacterized protein n=1 Tax=Trypanosoma cruzi TaxID=5693 RepID=A0A2V2VKP4_TRYCR|nr:hypothetical protein C3747_263g54 [Trypanosoma cruzi]
MVPGNTRCIQRTRLRQRTLLFVIRKLARVCCFPIHATTVAQQRQHEFPAIGKPRRKTREEREYERMQDRKEFLKAVLRDEMRDRLSAEDQLEELENKLNLRGSRHAEMLLAAAARRDAERQGGEDEAKTVGEQYEKVMEELRFVTRQPVGSKVNIIRLYYLLEEQERLKYLREKGKKQETWSTTRNR